MRIRTRTRGVSPAANTSTPRPDERPPQQRRHRASTGSAAPFLVVAPPALADACSIALLPICEVDRVTHAAHAFAALQQRAYSGVLSTHSLPDGDGLRVIARARGRDRDVPIVLVQDRADVQVRRLAQRQRALVLDEPLDVDVVVEVARAAVRRAGAFSTRLGAVLNAHGLTPTTREMLRLACLGLRNREIAAAMSQQDGTFKKHVQNVLATTGEEHWCDLVTRVLIEVGGGTPPPRARPVRSRRPPG